MRIHLLLKILLGFLGFTFIALQALEYEVEGAGISALMFIGLTLLYYRFSKRKSKFFFLFLGTFTIAMISSFASYFIPFELLEEVDFSYYFTNGLYILSYLFLIVHIIKSMNLSKTFKRFAGPIIILFILDVFCVYIVTDTAQAELNLTQYILEFTYNGVLMALLSIALINYLGKDTNKSMLFLIGSIFIVFSEIIQMAYFYVMSSNDLSATYATFLVMAFLFLYLQSQLKQEDQIVSLENEELRA